MGQRLIQTARPALTADVQPELIINRAIAEQEEQGTKERRSQVSRWQNQGAVAPGGDSHARSIGIHSKALYLPAGDQCRKRMTRLVDEGDKQAQGVEQHLHFTLVPQKKHR